MTRALVLGGGGVTGVAWELGLLAGLAARGLDVTGAELIAGLGDFDAIDAEVAVDDALASLRAGLGKAGPADFLLRPGPAAC